MKELEWSQDFPHYNPMEAICCHGNQSSDSILPKTLCSQSPTQMMLLMKFDYDWFQRYSCLNVWTHGRTHARTPARVPYYKLTLSLWLWWANNYNNYYVFIVWMKNSVDPDHLARRLLYSICLVLLLCFNSYMNMKSVWTSYIRPYCSKTWCSNFKIQ